MVYPADPSRGLGGATEGPAMVLGVSHDPPTAAPGTVGAVTPEEYRRADGTPEAPPHPVLCKIAEAVKLIVKGSTDSQCAFSDQSTLLRGKHGCFAHLDYDKHTGGILVNFVSDMHWRNLVEATLGKGASWLKPTWALNEKARVHVLLHEMLDSLLNPGEGQLSLLQTGAHLSDGYIPRRITCTGFGVGGALATLAACWAATQFATADVRCITLGAPCVGNKAFKSMFENLVGATYRVVLEGDAAAEAPEKEGFMKKYTPVGHTIWLHEGRVVYQARSVDYKL